LSADEAVAWFSILGDLISGQVRDIKIAPARHNTPVNANSKEKGVRARNAPSIGPRAQPMLVPTRIRLYSLERLSGGARSVRYASEALVKNAPTHELNIRAIAK